MADDFDDFEGDEGGGDDSGEVGGPAFAEEEAEAFGEANAGVDEGADAELFEVVLVDEGEFDEEAMDEDVFGVDAEEGDPVADFVGDVAMKKMQHAEAESEEESGFDEFEGADEHETFWFAGWMLFSAAAQFFFRSKMGGLRKVQGHRRV